jgi:hypothetical protein
MNRIIPAFSDNLPPGYEKVKMYNKTWGINKQWKAEQLEMFAALIRQKKSDRVIIVGNGPSLQHIDPSLLAGEDVIGSNNIMLHKDIFPLLTYYTTVDTQFAEIYSRQINSIKHAVKIVPLVFSYCILPDPNVRYFNIDLSHNFSEDAVKKIHVVETVTFVNMQLALAMGYKQVILIGVDNTYAQVKGNKHTYDKGDDPAHFDKDCARGLRYRSTINANKMLDVYKIAKTVYSRRNVEIINSTVGGSLELFPRVPLNEVLKKTNTYSFL